MKGNVIQTKAQPKIKSDLNDSKDKTKEDYTEKSTPNFIDYSKGFSQSSTYSGFFTNIDGINGAADFVDENFSRQFEPTNDEVSFKGLKNIGDDDEDEIFSK